jgi:hypothetical protein
MGQKRIASSRRETVEEVYQFMRWAGNSAGSCLPKITQRAEGGLLEYIPPEDPVARLLAHNDAETTNGQTHFYEVFTELLKSEGHIVRGVLQLPSGQLEDGGDVDQEETRPTSFLKQRLPEATDISSEEFRRIERLVQKRAHQEGDIGQIHSRSLLQHSSP